MNSGFQAKLRIQQEKGGISLKSPKRMQTEIEKRKAALSDMHVEMAEEAVELREYRKAVQEAYRISEMENAERSRVNNPNHTK